MAGKEKEDGKKYSSPNKNDKECPNIVAENATQKDIKEAPDIDQKLALPSTKDEHDDPTPTQSYKECMEWLETVSEKGYFDNLFSFLNIKDERECDMERLTPKKIFKEEWLNIARDPVTRKDIKQGLELDRKYAWPSKIKKERDGGMIRGTSAGGSLESMASTSKGVPSCFDQGTNTTPFSCKPCESCRETQWEEERNQYKLRIRHVYQVTGNLKLDVLLSCRERLGLDLKPSDVHRCEIPSDAPDEIVVTFSDLKIRNEVYQRRYSVFQGKDMIIDELGVERALIYFEAKKAFREVSTNHGKVEITLQCGLAYAIYTMEQFKKFKWFFRWYTTAAVLAEGNGG